MTRNLRTRSTDLSVLRSILIDNEELSTNINDLNNEKGFQSEIDTQGDHDDEIKNNLVPLDNNISNANLKADEIVKKKINSKLRKREVESPTRLPFFVTRINTHHKDNLSVSPKSADEEVQLETSGTIYKSVHYKNIVQKEERLQLKYRQLADLLQKDVVARTAAICDQSMNEARQLIQNSLATSRIISAFVSDTRSSGLVNKNQEIIVNSVPSVDTFVQSSTDPFHPSVTNTLTTIFGYDVTTPVADSSPKVTSDNRLNSEEPFIQNWLQTKDKEERKQKQKKRREWRIERAVTMDAERVLEQRKAAAKEAYRVWCQRKERSVRRAPRSSQSDDTRTLSEEEDEDSLPQAGRQPRPKQNFVYRRPIQSLARPKTAASFTIRTDLRMKLTGQRVTMSVSDTARSAALGAVRLQPSLLATINNEYRRPQTAMPRPRQEAPQPTIAATTKDRSHRAQPRRRKVTKVKRVSVDNRENTRPESLIGVALTPDSDTAKEEAASVSSEIDYDTDFD